MEIPPSRGDNNTICSDGKHTVICGAGRAPFRPCSRGHWPLLAVGARCVTQCPTVRLRGCARCSERDFKIMLRVIFMILCRYVRSPTRRQATPDGHDARLGRRKSARRPAGGGMAAARGGACLHTVYTHYSSDLKPYYVRFRSGVLSRRPPQSRGPRTAPGSA